jgi:hypothetical protein
MADRPSTQSTPKKETPESPLAQLQEAGLGSMLGMGTAWMEAFSDLGAEVANFVADRIREDVKTQHKILHCKDVAELQHIQAQFVQKAIEDYQTETGRLVEMTRNTFGSLDDDITKP